MTGKKVCIVQPVMKRYRVPFFEGLRDTLAASEVGLTVVYGRPWRQEALKGDITDLPPSLGRAVNGLRVGPLLVVPVWRPLVEADLVIVEQANKHVLNYLLLIARAAGLKRLAYWGHGRDRRAKGGAGEWFKRRTLGAVDWWFAYTQGVAAYVTDCGFPPDRVTAVQNTVDIGAWRTYLGGVGEDEVQLARERLGIGPAAPVGLYCGSLYREKLLDVLFRAGDLIRERLPDFALIVMGDGAQRPMVEAAARGCPWLHYVGPRFGRDKAVHYRIADAVLNPGLVGLSIMDAFGAGLPLITTDYYGHSPEIDYLEHGVNGWMTPLDPARYADAAARLLADRPRLREMGRAALAASQRLTMEAMVQRFAGGILACLAAATPAGLKAG